MSSSKNISPKLNSNVSRKNLRNNRDQMKYLVDYMSTHNMFAVGEFSGPLGRRARNEEWVRFQGALKELGPDITVEQWKNRDLKKKARFDGARHNEAINKTDNRPDLVPPVPSTSSKILSMIGTESAYGIGTSRETGLGEFPADVIIIEDYSPVIQPSNTTHQPHHSPPYINPYPLPHHSQPHHSPPHHSLPHHSLPHHSLPHHSPYPPPQSPPHHSPYPPPQSPPTLLSIAKPTSILPLL